MKHVLLLTLLLAATSCSPEFDTSSKTSCVTEEDCLTGYTCVEGPEGRFGVCESVDGSADGGRDVAGEDVGFDAPVDDRLCLDEDGDGEFAGAACEIGPLDCDDGAPDVNSRAPELCNGIDDDCDLLEDEDFDLLASIENCGACDLVCVPNHATVRCDAGTCVVMNCTDGWWDRNDDGTDGCEQPCTDAELSCGDGRDDDCDGSTDEDDDDCEGPGDLAGREFYLVAWETGGAPSIRIGRAAFEANGVRGRITEQYRSDLASPERGSRVADTLWEVAGITSDRVTVRAPAGQFALFRSPSAPTDLLVGAHGGTGELLLLVGANRSGAPPPVGHEWLSWIVSPYNELVAFPGGGAIGLGWEDPVELALLRYSATGPNGRGSVNWPFAEYRDRIDGNPESDVALRPLGYRLDADGTVSLELLTAGEPERVFTGAVTPAGDFAVGVHRYVGEQCTGRLVQADGACLHDPILSLSVRRAVGVGVGVLEGDWELVGLGYEVADGALKHQLYDIPISVTRDGLVSGGVSGTVGVFGSSGTFLPPTTRLDLRGDAVGGGTLTLEGHVTAGGIGLFWDLSGEVGARPMNGGFYLLIRRS